MTLDNKKHLECGGGWYWHKPLLVVGCFFSLSRIVQSHLKVMFIYREVAIRERGRDVGGSGMSCNSKMNLNTCVDRLA